MISKKLLLIITIVLVILYIFPPAIGYIPAKGVLYLGFPLIAFILSPRSFYNKQTFWYISGLIIWTSLFLIHNNYERLNWFVSIFSAWFNCLAMSNILLEDPNSIVIKRFSKISWYIILLSILLTFPMVYNDPMLIRETLSLSFLNEPGAMDNLIAMQKKGMVDYGFLHAVPSLFPLLFLVLKESKTITRKLWLLLLIILIYYFIILSNFGTIIILSTITLILSVITSNNLKKNIWKYIFITVILIPFFNSNFLINLLFKVLPFFESTIMADKINDIVLSITYDSMTGQLENRSNLYRESWISFTSSPLWGGYSDGGGHAMLIDFLGWFGILGIIPLLLFLFYIFKNAFYKINNQYRIFYLIAVFPYIVLSLVKGTSGFTQLFIISVFIPSMLIDLQGNCKKKI